MKINYDKNVDSLNLTFRSGAVDKTLEVAPEIMLDLDKEGRPLYLEIIGASEKVGEKNFRNVLAAKRVVRSRSMSPLARVALDIKK